MALHLPVETEIRELTGSDNNVIREEAYRFQDDYSFWCLNGVMMQTVTINGVQLDDPRKQRQAASVLGCFISDLYNDMISTGWDPGDALQEISSMYPVSK